MYEVLKRGMCAVDLGYWYFVCGLSWFVVGVWVYSFVQQILVCRGAGQ